MKNTTRNTTSSATSDASATRSAAGDIARIRDELSALRRRLRRLFVLHGGLRLTGEILLLVVLTYLADRLFVTPRGARLVQLAGIIALLGWRGWRLLVYPLSRRVRLRDLAIAVERRYPVLDGRLLSAMELSGELSGAAAGAADSPAEIAERPAGPEKPAGGRSRNLAPALVRRLLEDTRGLASQLDLQQVFTYRQILRYGMVAGVLLGVVVVHSLVFPQASRVYLERFFAGATPWPRATLLVPDVPDASPNYRLELLDSSSNKRHLQVSIARGASLPVLVRAEGRVPEQVFLRYDEVDGSVRDYQMGRRGEDQFFYRIRAMRRDGRFTVYGGDDDGEGRRIDVSVRVPPTLQSIRARLEPPAYTGVEASEQDSGHIDAPVGTRVALEMQFNVPLREARMAFDGRHDQARDLEPGTDPLTRSVEFIVERSGSYALDLVGENSFPNLDPISFSVVAINDRVPLVRLLDPGPSNIDVTPHALVLLRCEAADDYGVSGIELKHQLLGEDTASGTRPGAEGLSRPLPASRLLAWIRWDLRELRLASGDMQRALVAGDSLSYFWSVVDNGHSADGTPSPHEVTSQRRRIEVVTESEKIRLLTERQVRLKGDIERLRDGQQENLEQLTSLVEEGVSGDDPYAAADLIRPELDQNRITQRARRASKEFAELFEDYLVNRLDHSSAAERLLQAHILAKTEDAAPGSLAADGFDAALLRPRIEEFNSGVYGEMDVLSKLLTMLDFSMRISEDLSPDAYQALGEARITARDAQRPELVARAQEAQKTIVALLDQLLDRMDEWEDFQEVLELTREIVDDQRRINSMYRGHFKEDAGGTSGSSGK